MNRPIILLADNNPEFLETTQESLEQAGFKVRPAGTPDEARQLLDKGFIDLAVLDLRLINDEDENDFSGLEIAKEVAPGIPKILLTQWEEPPTEVIREAMSLRMEGLPSAVDFLVKHEGINALTAAIRKALRYESLFREMSGGLAKDIKKDYQDARRQAKMNFIVSLVVALAGVVLIFVGAGLALSNLFKVGSLGLVGGVLTEAVGYLFFRRADAANDRMDRYHRELLEIRWLENLLAASDESLEDADRLVSCKERIIEAATRRWFPGPGS